MSVPVSGPVSAPVEEMTLEARGAAVRFTARDGRVATALDGVDLAVRSGEIVAIVG